MQSEKGSVPMKYNINEGRRDYAIRLGCERGVYLFIHDYAEDMGISMSSAVRRLLLIGARCEKEHANLQMPKSYDEFDSTQIERAIKV